MPCNRQWEFPELCVSGPIHAVSDTQASKRLPNIMANWLRAANHVPDISAILFKVADGEIDQLGRRLVGREGAARLD